MWKNVRIFGKSFRFGWCHILGIPYLVLGIVCHEFYTLLPCLQVTFVCACSHTLHFSRLFTNIVPRTKARCTLATAVNTKHANALPGQHFRKAEIQTERKLRFLRTAQRRRTESTRAEKLDEPHDSLSDQSGKLHIIFSGACFSHSPQFVNCTSTLTTRRVRNRPRSMLVFVPI